MYRAQLKTHRQNINKEPLRTSVNYQRQKERAWSESMEEASRLASLLIVSRHEKKAVGINETRSLE